MSRAAEDKPMSGWIDVLLYSGFMAMQGGIRLAVYAAVGLHLAIWVAVGALGRHATSATSFWGMLASQCSTALTPEGHEVLIWSEQDGGRPSSGRCAAGTLSVARVSRR
jgi:hypothetical protein